VKLHNSMLFALTAALVSLGTASAARADEADGAMRIDFPKPRDNAALSQWRDQRGWRYSTDYLFGATRGLEEQNIPLMCRRAAWIATVPLDVANLPFAAAAGLFGD
jgi:hypothetical protein